MTRVGPFSWKDLNALIRKSFWLLLMLAVLPFAQVASAHRVALIFGTEEYINLPSLNTPIGDAELIATTVSELGFTDIRIVRNATKDEMRKELEAFQDRSDGAEVALIYFVGHGVQITKDQQREPRAAPAITGPLSPEAIPGRTTWKYLSGAPEDGLTGFLAASDWNGKSSDLIAVANLVNAVRRAKRPVIVVDACRSELLDVGGTVIAENLSTRLATSWLWYPMSLEQLVYISSTSNGEPSYDPSGPNSAFGSVFATLIKEKSARDATFADSLSENVNVQTNGWQTPFVFSNIDGIGNPLKTTDDLPPTAASTRVTFSGETILEPLTDAKFDKDGKLIFATNGKIVDLEGKVLFRAPGLSAISRDGSQALLSARGGVRILTLSSGKRSAVLPISSGYRASDFAGHGELAVVLEGNILTGIGSLFSKGYKSEVEDRGEITAIAIPHFGNGSPQLNTAVFGTSFGAICLYEPPSSQAVQCQAGQSRIMSIRANPRGGSIVVLTASGRVQLRSLNGLQHVADFRLPKDLWPLNAAFSADGQILIVSADDKAFLFSAVTTAMLAEVRLKKSEQPMLRLSPDATKLAAAYESGEVYLWNISYSR
jgi:Caspase domain